MADPEPRLIPVAGASRGAHLPRLSPKNNFGACGIFLGMVILQTVAGAVHANDRDYCDSGLPIDKTNPLSYQNRGERCEGLYIRQVVGEPLKIAGFAVCFDSLDVTRDSSFSVKWPKVNGEIVQLRAISLRPKTYYRMDSARPTNSDQFNWPTDVLKAVKLSAKDIGVSGWVEGPTLKGRQVPMYVPLCITENFQQAAADISSGHYGLVLLPTTQLQQVFVTLCPVENGTVGSPLEAFNSVDIDQGYYPADRPFTIQIPLNQLKPSIQTYYCTVGATLMSGGSVSVEGCFYNRLPN